MYKQLISTIIFILFLLFASGDDCSLFVNKALAESPSGSYSITSNNTFSSSFRITVQGISDAIYFNIFKKSNNTVINSVPISISSALNSMPAVYADIADLEVRVYSDPAGVITIAEFTLTGPNQLVFKGSTLPQNSTTSSTTGSFSNTSTHKDNSVTKTLNGNKQLIIANDATAPIPKTDNTLSGNTITVIVNGTPVVFDQPPLIINSRTIAPMRAIFEAMGAQVSWDPITQTAAATNGATTIVVKIGSTEATVNGATKILDVPAQIINNRTLVPVRFISESLGAKVDWAETTKTVTIK